MAAVAGQQRKRHVTGSPFSPWMHLNFRSQGLKTTSCLRIWLMKIKGVLPTWDQPSKQCVPFMTDGHHMLAGLLRPDARRVIPVIVTKCKAEFC